MDLPDRMTIFRYRLATAFLLSLLLHALLYSGYQWAKTHGLFNRQATWLLFKQKKAPLKPAPLAPAQTTHEIPLTFVEVDPAVASAEVPPDTTFYGARSSVAANEEAAVETEAPKSQGKQQDIPRTADVPKPLPFPLQPSPPPEPAPAPAPKPAETAMTKVEPGDLAKAKPVERAVMPVEPKPRPRTLQEARRQLALAGEKVKQDAGTRRRATLSFNVKATEFGAYDEAFITAVQERWYALLDNASYLQHAGRVVLEFRLTYDGRITDMRVAENEVGEILSLLCQRAVMDPAPYAAWPSDMRRKMGNYRDVRFTFYYN